MGQRLGDDHQQLLERGRHCLKTGQWQRAIELLTQAHHRQPGRFEIIRSLACALLHGGYVNEARRTLSSYNHDAPMCEQGWRAAALLEWKLGQRQAALDVLRRAIEKLPGSAVLQRQQRVFMSAMGTASDHGMTADHPGNCAPEQSGATDLLDQVVQDTGLLECMLANASESADGALLEQICERLTALVELQSRHADRQALLARVRLMLGDTGGAMRAAQEALRVNPAFVQAQRIVADIYERLGDIEAALRTLQDLVTRGLDWPDLHYQIAVLQQRRGEPGQARQHLYRALQASPGYAQANELLTRCAA